LLTDDLEDQGAAGSAVLSPILNLQGAGVGARSDLRKPYSTSLEYLDTVLDLNGDPVAGYPTLNAIGIGQNGKQALLYHKTYSSLEDEFMSEREEIRIAIQTVTSALRAQGVGRIIWILDRGFDDRKVINWILETGGCYVIRARHDRVVSTDLSGPTRKLFKVTRAEPILGTFSMKRPVLVDGKLKKRPVQATARTGTVWLSAPAIRVNAVALEFVQARGNRDDAGWILLTNLPVESFEAAQHVIFLYVLRWSIEEVFAWTKPALDWESTQLLEFAALELLVAMAWVTAAFVFELSDSLESSVLDRIAFLGGWVPRVGSSPGRRVLVLGLGRVLASLLVEQVLDAHERNALRAAFMR
jgi:Transposase DDE domain